MHFARGEYEAASAIGRRAFERAPSAIAGDLHDSISLLWRLALVGMDVRARWAPFTAIAAARLDRQGLLFHAAHLAMALAGGGDWRRAIERLEPLRPRIIQLGGSRAQRDVFHDTLLEACFRAGDLERAERLLVERLHRRPDHFWKTRGAA